MKVFSLMDKMVWLGCGSLNIPGAIVGKNV